MPKHKKNQQKKKRKKSKNSSKHVGNCKSKPKTKAKTKTKTNDNRIKQVKEIKELKESINRSSSECSVSILRSSDGESHSCSHMYSDSHSVSFGAVEVHEFPLLCGSESDGVPENGAFSLHLAPNEIKNETFNVEEYENKRYERWKERAKQLHWNNKKMRCAMHDPEKYLFTAGRCDGFYCCLDAKEREKRLSIDKEWKERHEQELKQEKTELNRIRKSRRSNGIFCVCKPLSSMSTSELKASAEQYGIKLHKHKKVKKGFLINQLKAKVLNYRDNICCWNKLICSCAAAGIGCHSGTKEGNFQCGCVKYHKKCKNQNGIYIYKEPHYNTSLINEWHRYYKET